MGNAVRDTLPRELYVGDTFECYPRWFEFCTKLLVDIAKGNSGDILVPMMLTECDSFEKIAAPARRAGAGICHVFLRSDRSTVRSRILERGEDEDCRCMENSDLCLERQETFTDVIPIISFGRTPRELAREVMDEVRTRQSRSV